jgi:ankyrin repeat protein
MNTSNEIAENTSPFKNLPVEIKKIIAFMVFFNNTKDAAHFQLVSKTFYVLLDARIWKAYFFHLFPHIKLIKAPSKEEDDSQSFWKGLIKEAKGAYLETINSINNNLIKQLFKAIYQNNPQNLTNALNAISGSISDLTYFFTDERTTTHLQLPDFSPASFTGSLNRGLPLKKMYDYVLSKENQNKNTLFWAAAFNQVDVIDALTLTDWNTPAIDGKTPFFIACQQDHLEIVTRLLQHKDIEVNARVTYGGTPLYIACYNGYLEIVRRLLQHKDIEVNARTTHDVTPLYIACQKGYLGIVARLLQHKDIEVNARTTHDVTPLYIACQKGYLGIVARLLQHQGIEVNQARVIDGATPLHIACYNGYLEIVTRLLQHQGIEVNQACTDNGATPLYIACQNGYLEIVTRLLQHPEIKVNQARVTYGSTPLYIACQKGYLEIVRRLLQHPDIQVNQARTDDGATPLYIACQQGHFNIVFDLLLKGANLNATKHNGETPLDIAKKNNHVAVVRLINLFSKLSESHANKDKETLLLDAFKDYLVSYRRQWLVRPILRFFGDSGKHHGDSIQEAFNDAKLKNTDNIDFKQFIGELNQKNINAKKTGEFYMLLKLANHYLDTKEQPSASIDKNTPLSPKPS